MKNKLFKQLLLSLFLIIIIMGCSPNFVTLSNNKFENQSETETVKSPNQINTDNVTHRFSVQAKEQLKQAISILYQSYFPNELPFFVEENGDLLVTQYKSHQIGRPSVPFMFLPSIIFESKADIPDLDEFNNFAISLSGQQKLINAGILPKEINITDQAGNTLKITQPIERVISAYGPATAMIYSVGAADRLVAASYLGARDAQGAAAMERIDPRFQTLVSDDYFSQQEFNLEQAVSLNPDLIIASSRSTWVESVSQLGIQIFLVEAETTNQLKEATLLIGQLFGSQTSAQAQTWVAYYDWVLESINDSLKSQPQSPKPGVLFTGTNPLRIASGEMYQTEMIEAAGGISVSESLQGYWNDVNLEQVALWDPNIILVPPYGGATTSAIIDSAEWQIFSAVQNKFVYQMPKLVAPWDTPSPDSILGIIWATNLFYPRLSTLNCTEEVNYFYETYYNYSLTSDESAKLCSFE